VGQVKTPRKCSGDKPGYERTRLPAVTTAVAGGTRVPQYPGPTWWPGTFLSRRFWKVITFCRD
jgi:hypothetical protein